MLSPAQVLVDGRRGIKGLKLPQTPVVEGDRLLPSIAAALIIAKVTRDRMMEKLGEVHPGYGFEQHKGYGTLGHLTALAQLGPLVVHRHSFMPGDNRGTSAAGFVPRGYRLRSDETENALLK